MTIKRTRQDDNEIPSLLRGVILNGIWKRRGLVHGNSQVKMIFEKKKHDMKSKISGKTEQCQDTGPSPAKGG